ncbi:MAG: serine acetyltransferase [Clostridia bacterium]|nr:serine acetyltransferase [Clostridia bacterium]
MQTLPDFKGITDALLDHGEALATPPSRKEIIAIIKDIQYLMFPAYFNREGLDAIPKTELLSSLYERIVTQIRLSFGFCGKSGDSEALAKVIVQKLPDIKGMLKKDVIALYEGDPAATCTNEVMLTYPGFYAISIYRIAHEFYILGIPYIARLMTEYSHEKTGIDIHAGAKIGEYFFIDHGTGIVIGETTTIGNRVKIYQGVTLGAKSFELDSDGNPIKGTKRHPDIGDNVVIYANATILGGNTKIGDGCIIGGNVWLTRSVAAGEVVYYGSRGEGK